MSDESGATDQAVPATLEVMREVVSRRARAWWDNVPAQHRPQAVIATEAVGAFVASDRARSTNEPTLRTLALAMEVPACSVVTALAATACAVAMEGPDDVLREMASLGKGAPGLMIATRMAHGPDQPGINETLGWIASHLSVEQRLHLADACSGKLIALGFDTESYWAMFT